MLREIKRAGFAERLFDAGEVTLNYVVGPDNGPPLVLLPAQMATWESYGKVLLPLARRFRVFAPDLRGHGKSGWATGRYSWATLGADVAAFLNRVVGRPALVSGNSSGGLVALWLAANHPDRVAGGVLEDAPVFSAELPRFRDRDQFVYAGLARAVAALGDLEHRDLADYFRDQELPLADGRVRRVPGCLVRVLSAIIRRRAAANPRGRVDVPYLPPALRLLIRSLSTFDPDCARAFVDGRFYEGLDHAEALRRVRCPLLVLHADWFRHPRHGLVGAMDDADAARILELVPQARYRRIAANHVIHYFRPRAFVREVEEFAAQLEWWPGETRRDSS